MSGKKGLHQINFWHNCPFIDHGQEYACRPFVGAYGLRGEARIWRAQPYWINMDIERGTRHQPLRHVRDVKL